MAKTAKNQPSKPRVLEQVQPTATPEQAPASTEKPKTQKAKRDRSALYAKYTPVDTDVIRIVPGGKPKVKGSKAAALFALYEDGMTVGDLLKKANEAKLPRKHSLYWDIAHNLIRIEKASS